MGPLVLVTLEAKPLPLPVRDAQAIIFPNCTLLTPDLDSQLLLLESPLHIDEAPRAVAVLE